MNPLRFGLIGYGAIAKTVLRQLEHMQANQINRDELHPFPQCIGILVRDASQLNSSIAVSTVEDFLAAEPGLVVEAAGHLALAEYGPTILQHGVDCLVASVGALANAELESTLRLAAQKGRSSILIPAGALGCLDALRAARWAGIDEVVYRSEKSPLAWLGTPAEQLVDLAHVTQTTVFFEGTAREAATLFPQNANVAAAIALAGVGFEATKVQLCADPQAKTNRHMVKAHGAFGRIDTVIEGRVLPENPKTSMLAPMSIVEALMSRHSALRVI